MSLDHLRARGIPNDDEMSFLRDTILRTSVVDRLILREQVYGRGRLSRIIGGSFLTHTNAGRPSDKTVFFDRYTVFVPAFE